MTDSTYFDRLKARLLNNKWISYLVLAAVVAGGIAKVWKELSDVVPPKPPVARSSTSAQTGDALKGERARVQDLLRPIYFAPSSYHLSPEETRKVVKYAALLSEAKFKRLVLRAHTQARSPIPNLNLSAERARAVEQALLQAGLPADRIEIANFGGEQATSALEGEGKAPQ